MSTRTPTPVRENSAGRHDSPSTQVASSRPTRRRRSTFLILAASLAVLVLFGLQIHRSVTDPSTADGSPVSPSPRQESGAPTIDKADPVQPPPKAKPPPTAKPQPKAKPPPTVGAIDPSLSRALDRARTEARTAGLNLRVTSGFRSAAKQQRLYDQAIAKYGSPEIARHWVLPPAESAHVKGLAVDVGPHEAATWLEKHGARHGLCRRYLNEWWHFELLAPAVGQKCPALEPYAGG